jgi:hypothetical protein
MTTLPRTTKIEINNTRPRCIDNSSQCFTTTTRCSLQSPSLLQLSFDSKPDRQFDCQGSPGGHDCRQWDPVGLGSYVPSVTIWARLWSSTRATDSWFSYVSPFVKLSSPNYRRLTRIRKPY